MKTALLAFLRAHWPLALAAVLGACAGWFAHRQQPSITVVTDTKTAAASSGQQDTHGTMASRDIDIKIGRGAAPRSAASAPADPLWRPAQSIIPDCVTGLPAGSRVRIHEGPSTEETHAQAQALTLQEQHVELKEVYAQPRYSLFVGAQVRPELHLALGGAVRIGPVWLQAEVAPQLSKPLESTILVGLRKDF